MPESQQHDARGQEKGGRPSSSREQIRPSSICLFGLFKLLMDGTRPACIGESDHFYSVY